MKGIEGTVVAQVTVDVNGNVSDASVLSGPEELRKAVLQSLLSWHFTKDAAGGARQIAVTFRMPDPAAAAAPLAAPVRGVQSGVVGGVPGGIVGGVQSGMVGGILTSTPANAPLMASDGRRVIRAISVTGLDIPAEEVLAKLPLHVDDEWRPETMMKFIEAVHQIDEHLNVSAAQIPPNGIVLRISAPGSPMVADVARPATSFPGAIPVGGQVQNSLLISRTDPVYPEIAKSARISGTVEFAALIGADGHMKELQVVSGHPLLRQAALDAVKQWVYKPTLLNGSPTPVSTTIDVVFSLSQ
jgi:TonB family protein